MLEVESLVQLHPNISTCSRAPVSRVSTHHTFGLTRIILGPPVADTRANPWHQNNRLGCLNEAAESAESAGRSPIFQGD